MILTRKNSSIARRWAIRVGALALSFALAAPVFGLAGAQRGERERGGRHAGFSGFRAQQEHRGHGDRGFQRERPAMHRGGGRQFRQDHRNPHQQQREMRQEDRRAERPTEPSGPSGNRPAYRPEMNSAGRSEGHPGDRPALRPGQDGFRTWWQRHRELPPQQQAEALRRQPGFRSLPHGQQQRLINRLRDFDQRSPREQQRTLGRVEMFERLSPQRKQEVRGASQALSRMPQQRQQAMRQAFRELRQMPPEERQQMLHSSYGQRFTPQERTVLGNLLSIEPYQGQPEQQPIPQPYFGRR